MKVEKFNLVIGLASCPLLSAFLTSTWHLGLKAVLVIFAYLILFLFYTFIPWKYKSWLAPKSEDPSEQQHANTMRHVIQLIHKLYIVFFVLIQLIGTSAVLVQAYIPDFADEIILQSIPEKSLSALPVKPRLNYAIKDTLVFDEDRFSIAIRESTTISTYPLKGFLDYAIPYFLKPIWDLIYSVFLLYVVVLFFTWLFEFSAHDKFRHTT